jgi:hypothetical protein
MPTDLETSATPEPASAATQDTGPAPDQGTAQPDGEAKGQSAPVEEKFGDVDPKTLPPQLKAVYDNMLRGFKEKTTKVSDTVKAEVAKATESLKAKADLYDQFAGRQDFVDQWNEYVRAANGQPSVPTDPVQRELQEIKAELAKRAEADQQREVSEIVDAFRDATNDKGEKLNPDFDKLNSIVVGQAGDGSEYSLLRCYIELAQGASPQEKLAAGYKAAKAEYDRIFEEGRKSGMGHMRAKVQRSTEPPTGTSISANVTEKYPKDAREALDLAYQGISVRR